MNKVILCLFLFFIPCKVESKDASNYIKNASSHLRLKNKRGEIVPALFSIVHPRINFFDEYDKRNFVDFAIFKDGRVVYKNKKEKRYYLVQLTEDKRQEFIGLYDRFFKKLSKLERPVYSLSTYGDSIYSLIDAEKKRAFLLLIENDVLKSEIDHESVRIMREFVQEIYKLDIFHGGKEIAKEELIFLKSEREKEKEK